MFDIKWIRDNPEEFDRGMERRGLEPQAAGLIALDATRREAQTKAQDIQAERNRLSKEIGAAKAKGEDAQDIMDAVSKTKTAEAEAEKAAEAATAALEKALSELPNLPADDVPDGPDEASNEEVRTWGDKPTFDFDPKEHFDIGEALGLMDFETAARMSGARFVLLSGALAHMERALANFMLDLHTIEHDLTEVNPPALVNDSAMFGTGQLPKFGEDLFKLNDEREYHLIPTSEVPLTNFVRDEIVELAALPMKLTAHTPCFRSEAGAYGRDTRGMIRQHQFDKVEMVQIVEPEKSYEALEEMRGHAEAILQALELPYRVVTLCTGDMGFGAAKTYDLEVWLPSQNTYREISSVSNCEDFQARRMQARYRHPDSKKPQLLHTLNGSGLAVGRCLLAVLENHQQADGSITVPAPLQPYLGGLDRLAL